MRTIIYLLLLSFMLQLEAEVTNKEQEDPKKESSEVRRPPRHPRRNGNFRPPQHPGRHRKTLQGDWEVYIKHDNSENYLKILEKILPRPRQRRSEKGDGKGTRVRKNGERPLKRDGKRRPGGRGKTRPMPPMPPMTYYKEFFKNAKFSTFYLAGKNDMSYCEGFFTLKNSATEIDKLSNQYGKLIKTSGDQKIYRDKRNSFYFSVYKQEVRYSPKLEKVETKAPLKSYDDENLLMKTIVPKRIINNIDPRSSIIRGTDQLTITITKADKLLNIEMDFKLLKWMKKERLSSTLTEVIPSLKKLMLKKFIDDKDWTDCLNSIKSTVSAGKDNSVNIHLSIPIEHVDTLLKGEEK